MDKNKRVMKKVLATALSLSVFGTAVAEKGTIGSAVWPFTKSHTQEEISSAYEKGFSLINDGLKLVKGLDDQNEAQDYMTTLNELKNDLDDDDKRTYDKAIGLQKAIKKLLNDMHARINLQEIERRKAEEKRAKQIEDQKRQAELEEKQKEEEHRRKLEEQRLQMEKEEKEKQEAIKNAIVSLQEKLDSILRDASKKIENAESFEHINARAEEIREKIQQIDNLNRVSGIEVLFGDLQAEIETTLEKEEKVRQLNSELDSIMKDASKKIENPENIDRINSMAAELREKIQQIDNLNRVSEVEVLFGELQTEITNVLAEEETIRQENLKRSLEEAKAGLFELRETLQNLLSDLDEENENYAKFSDMIISYNPGRIDSIDNLEGAEAVKNEFESAISKVNVLLEQQIQKIEEEKAKEELETQIEMFQDPEGQIAMLKEGKLSLDDVMGGNQEAKSRVKALIKSYKRYNSGGKIVPPKGLLFYGPPGTGKTSLAEAVAAAEGLELFKITPSSVMEDNGERKLLEVFGQAKKAAQISGKLVIILIDEIDAIAQKRSSTGSDKVLVMMMNELDKLTPRDNVIILATTNRREALDPAITRSGRLDQSVEVGHPNSEGKKEIITIYLRYLIVADDVRENIDNIADKMRGFSGADIMRVIHIAIESAMVRQNVERFTEIIITMEDIQRGIATVMGQKTSIY